MEGSVGKQEVTSLKDLINRLEQGEDISQIEKLDHLEIDIEELHPYINWNSKFYTRNCIAKNEEFELLLLCWEPDQITKIHSHDQQECWVQVISGEFREEQYMMKNNELTRVSNELLEINQTTFVEDNKIYHTLENVSGERAMSLHLYQKPITKCDVFNQETETFNTISLSYYSMKGEVLV